MFSKKSQRLLISDLAGIQYIGHCGITASCIAAITLLLNGGQQIKNAFLITCEADHAFLLVDEFDDVIAIKDGFSSGYSGEGPRGLATALVLLHRHNIEIEEYKVTSSFMERLAQSCLLHDDLDFILKGRPVRPRRWHDYVYDQGQDLNPAGKRFSRHYPLTIPFGLVDERIIDLAVNFYGNEDATIISAFRRLEEIIRKRTGLTGEGSKLFSKAFFADDAPLRWDVPDENEGKGRASLFSAIYMAFRNARAHREIEPRSDSELREFLLANELYRLEAEAMTEQELKKKKNDEISLENDFHELKRISNESKI